MPKQHQQVIVWVSDDLELIAARLAVTDFKSIDGDTRPEQTDAEVKLVDFCGTVGETNRREAHVLEGVQAVGNSLPERSICA